MKLVSLIYKDILLLVRDVWGIVLLFLMPWALVLLMTYLQDSTFRTVNETRIPLYLLNADRDSLGNMVSRQLLASGIFDISTEADGHLLSAENVEKAIARGDYMIGIIIPERTTQELRKNVRLSVERVFNGENEPAPDSLRSPMEIKLLIDPTAKHSFRTSIVGAMRENVLTIRNKLLLQEISQQMNRILPVPIDMNIDTDEWIIINESYAQSERARIIPNATQHNVPAWSMFSIFFIVISLAGNMIRERETGCFNRLMTMPCSYSTYLFSKIIVYLCVCLMQMTTMLLTGLFVTRLLGLPALQLGESLGALALMSVSAALSAIGYGLAIGAIARTNQQASIFGAVSVVILAAIGGVWIPTFVMPHFMQIVSHLSPLNWGMNGFNELFVRDRGFAGIAPYCAASLLFFGITLGIAMLTRYSGNRKM